MSKAKDDADSHPDSVLGHVIPRRRFTRWALYYVLLYLCLPLLALGLITDLVLYTLFNALFGKCYALFCLFT